MENNQKFYLSDLDTIQKACKLTGLAEDEIEHVVGRFATHSARAGQLKGEVVITDTDIRIRHHFTKKSVMVTKSGGTMKQVLALPIAILGGVFIGYTVGGWQGLVGSFFFGLLVGIWRQNA